MGALSGIKVADFSRVLAGPYATMMLADMRATVTKIERKGVGDDTRHWAPPVTDSGISTYFASVNRNKNTVALDLRDPDDLATARDLIAEADVVIENFRPGTMDKLGLGFDAARELNPAVVYASLSGFGSGAGRDLGGYDLVVQAMGGLMSITGPSPDGVGDPGADTRRWPPLLPGRHRPAHGDSAPVPRRGCEPRGH